MNNELNSSIDIFLHIGLHKTATTYLQHAVFPNLKGVTYHNKSLKLVKLHTGQNKILISNEGMSGCPYVITECTYFEQFKLSINQLLNIFNNPKIIVCFREPSRFIQSCYKQHLHEGGTLEWDEFFSIRDNSKLKPDDFFFSEYVKFLSKKVSNENLFIYDFETFKKNPETVINVLAKFITGKNFPGKMKKSGRSNSGVPLSLEGSLLKINKLFGNKMTFRVFGKVISQGTVLQTLIPRYFNFHKKRDLTHIEKYFASDYGMVKNMISELNPRLFQKI